MKDSLHAVAFLWQFFLCCMTTFGSTKYVSGLIVGAVCFSLWSKFGREQHFFAFWQSSNWLCQLVLKSIWLA